MQASTWQRRPRSQRQRSDVGDRVDHPLGVRRRRAHHHDRRVRAGGLERRRAGPEVGADRHPDQVDVEVVGRLGERGVRALAGDDARALRSPGRAPTSRAVFTACSRLSVPPDVR